MGSGSKWIAANEGDRLRSCKAHDVGGRQEKDRSGDEGQMGEVQSGEEGVVGVGEISASRISQRRSLYAARRSCAGEPGCEPQRWC